MSTLTAEIPWRRSDDVLPGPATVRHGRGEGGRRAPIAINEIAASWERCRSEHRIDPNDRRPPAILPESNVDVLRESLERVLMLAREELNRLYALVRPIGSAVVVASPNGVIVERRCEHAEAVLFSASGITPGALWPEHTEGTNGIGTCIFEQRPVSVHRMQHYRERHVGLSSAGAPIFGPDGRLTAILNVTSHATEISDRSHALALIVVANCSRAIEERLFREHYRRHRIMALERTDASNAAILLAIDADHRIVGADRNARTALAFSEERLEMGLDLWSVFHGSPSSLPERAVGVAPVRLIQKISGERWCGMLTPAAEGVNGHGTADTRSHVCAHLSLISSKAEPARGGLAPGALRRVREHIKSHLGRSIRLEELAAEAGLSLSHFCRAFKQTVGVAPHDYVMRQRVEKAAQQLSDSNRRLSDIALESGFADQSHFSRHFSRLLGSTPGAFRRAQR